MPNLGERIARVETKVGTLCKLMDNHLTEHKASRLRVTDIFLGILMLVLIAMQFILK